MAANTYTRRKVATLESNIRIAHMDIAHATEQVSVCDKDAPRAYWTARLADHVANLAELEAALVIVKARRQGKLDVEIQAAWGARQAG